MATFKYKAISVDGAPVSGVIEAFDEIEAVDLIKRSCRIVTSVSEIVEKQERRDLRRGRKIREDLISLMCSQFAIILKAGLPIVRCVELIAGQSTDKELKRLLLKVASDVANGHGLADSFEHKGGRQVPSTFIETIRAGEESGTLDEAFEKLKIYFENSHQVKRKIKGAMAYPMFILGLAFIVIGIVFTVALPVFLDMFDQFDVEMPAITQLLIDMSDFMQSYWYILLLAIIALIVGIKVYSATEDGRMGFAKLRLRLPVFKQVVGMNGAAQFANTLSTLLGSGLPMIRAVTITSRVLDNYHLGTRLGLTASPLEEGRRLGECLHDCACFPDMLVEMAAIGEETGTLEDTLRTMGAYYNNETQMATSRALGMLTPAITIFLGFIIAFVVLALYMPMFSMYGGM